MWNSCWIQKAFEVDEQANDNNLHVCRIWFTFLSSDSDNGFLQVYCIWKNNGWWNLWNQYEMCWAFIFHFIGIIVWKYLILIAHIRCTVDKLLVLSTDAKKKQSPTTQTGVNRYETRLKKLFQRRCSRPKTPNKKDQVWQKLLVRS